MALVFLALASATAPLLGQEPTIDRERVERIIRVLASDEMEGRAAFTPAADRAAEFIAGEFASIGLDKLDGSDGYLQRFALYSVTSQSCEVVLNGRRIPNDRIASSLTARQLEWTQDDGIEVAVLEADTSPARQFSTALRSGANTLLIVGEDQAQAFAQLTRIAGRANRTMDLQNGAGVVAVLSDDAEVMSFSVRATAEVEEQGLSNVVATIPGLRADEFVLFSAHYDHIGIRSSPVNGDAIANGANDDASGTTAVIELARYFKDMGKPERTLLFAAFTAEERGGYGSRYFSAQLDPDQIVAMINIEMIGKPAAAGPNTAWITGFERSSFGKILQAAVEGTEYEFHPDPYPRQNLFYRSDNATLARLGVPAHSISTTPIDVDPDYHQVTDEVDTLDLDHMTNTIRAIAAGAATIISGAATPSRVDPATVR